MERKFPKQQGRNTFSITFGFSLQHYPPETASLGISALGGCFQPPRKFDNPMAAMQLARTYQSVNFAAKTDTGWMNTPFVSHHVELSFTSQGIRSVCPTRRHPFQSTSPTSTAASFIDACKEILTRGCAWWFFLSFFLWLLSSPLWLGFVRVCLVLFWLISCSLLVPSCVFCCLSCWYHFCCCLCFGVFSFGGYRFNRILELLADTTRTSVAFSWACFGVCVSH